MKTIAPKQQQKLIRTLTLGALVIATTFVAQRAHAAIDLGDASVRSQQGQRLKIAVPYGSAPGQRVSAVRFVVSDIEVPPGYKAPAVNKLTILKPIDRNIVYVQSSERFYAPSVQMKIRVVDSDTDPTTFNLRVPPAKLVALSADDGVAVSKSGNKQAGKRKSGKSKKTAKPVQAAQLTQ
jgi:hypothetical protein